MMTNPLPVVAGTAEKLSQLLGWAQREAERLWGGTARVTLEKERQGPEGTRPVRIARRAVVHVGTRLVARTRWMFPYRNKGSTAERVVRMLWVALEEMRSVTPEADWCVCIP